MGVAPIVLQEPPHLYGLVHPADETAQGEEAAGAAAAGSEGPGGGRPTSEASRGATPLPMDSIPRYEILPVATGCGGSSAMTIGKKEDCSRWDRALASLECADALLHSPRHELLRHTLGTATQVQSAGGEVHVGARLLKSFPQNVAVF